MYKSQELGELRNKEGFLTAQMVEFRNQANMARNLAEAAGFRRQADEAGLELERVRRQRMQVESLF